MRSGPERPALLFKFLLLSQFNCDMNSLLCEKLLKQNNNEKKLKTWQKYVIHLAQLFKKQKKHEHEQQLKERNKTTNEIKWNVVVVKHSIWCNESEQLNRDSSGNLNTKSQ